MQTYTGKNVLITGGSSGIGLAFAKAFARRGASVWLLARRTEQLQIALNEIMAMGISRELIHLLSADVSNIEQVTAAIEEMNHASAPIDILVNSAGIAFPGEVINMDIDIYKKIVDINYLGTVYSTKAVLPIMLTRRKGTIINISSMAGFLGVYGYSAYGPSKYAIRGFSDSVRSELKPYGIQVSIVFPPDVDTPQLDEEKKLKPPVTAALWDDTPISPDLVAERTIRGIEKHRYIILPNFNAWITYHLSNFIGPLIYPLMDFLVSRAIRKSGQKDRFFK